MHRSNHDEQSNTSTRKAPPAALDLTRATRTTSNLSNGAQLSPVSPTATTSTTPSPSSVMFPTNYNARASQRTSVQSSRPKPSTSKTATIPRRTSGTIVPGVTTTTATAPLSSSTWPAQQHARSQDGHPPTMTVQSRTSDYSSRRSPLPSPTAISPGGANVRRTSHDLKQSLVATSPPPTARPDAPRRRQSRDSPSTSSAAPAMLRPSVLDRPRPRTPEAVAATHSPELATPRQPAFAGPNYQNGRASPAISKQHPSDGFFGSTVGFERDRPLDLSLKPETSLPTSSEKQDSATGPTATAKTRQNETQHRPVTNGVSRSESMSKRSILDRPRPKTPDSAAVFLANEDRVVTPVHESQIGPSNKTAPENSSSAASTPFKLGALPSSASHEWKGSVLDRPRPRTPDPQAFLGHTPPSKAQSQRGPLVNASPRPPSFSKAPLATQVKPSMIPITTPTASPTMTRQSPLLHQQPLVHSPSSDRTRRVETYRSSQGGGRPSHDGSLPRSVSGMSSTSRASSSLAPPTLSLDLDLSGSSTMFDLTSLLKFGQDDDAAAATPRAERRPELPSMTTATPNLSEARAQTVQTPTSTSSTLPAQETPDMSTLSLVPSRGTGATTPLGRKEPPKVDMMLELELELEKSMALNRPEPRLDLAAPVVAAQQPVGEISTPPRANMTTKRRKNSLASLLSFASSAGGADDSPKRRNQDSSSSPSAAGGIHRRNISSGSHSRPSEDRQPRPSFDALGFSRSESSAFGSVDSMPPSTSGHSLSSSRTHGRPSMSLDKSLPPPPTGFASSGRKTNEGASSDDNDNDGGNDNTTSPSSKSSIGKQFTRLRNRAQQQSHSGFQVVSATTTRQPFGQRQAESSARTSLPALRDDRYDGDGTSATRPADAAASSSSSTSVGRRLLGKLGGGARKISGSSGNKRHDVNGAPSSAFASEMSVDDHSSGNHRDSGGSAKFFKRPRRSSISNLLNGGGGGDGKEDKERRSSGAAAGMLGMSLAAARKSADMLTSWQKKDKQEQRQPSTSTSTFDSTAPSAAVERRSFDLLSSRKDGRKTGSDDYRDLSSAKLSPVQNRSDTKVQPGFRAPSRSTRPKTPSSVASSSDSGDVSYGEDDEIDRRVYGAALPSHASVATAQRVMRSGGESTSPSSSPALNSSPTLSRGSATPVLVQSSSLRQYKGSTAATTSQVDKPNLDTTDTDTEAARSVSRSSDIFSTPQLIQTPDTDQTDRTTLGPFAQETSLSAEWMMLDTSLTEYTSAMVGNVAERGNVLVNVLIPFMKREEANPSRRASAGVTSIQRDILFRWLSLLTTELREMQPAHRGACLESVAAIAESHFLSASTLRDDPFAQARYRAAIVEILSFAVDKLNEKAVYANTLVFSGRVMALAFFRIEGVALKLLRALPRVKRQCFTRVLAEAGIREHQLPTVNLELFPTHLWSLCLRDMKSYLDLLLPPARKLSTPPTMIEDEDALVRDAKVVVEMAGNWLIRWTASDSDLPFAFYRAYHRQLAHHLVPMDQRRYLANQHPLDPASVITAPGALFLAASLLEKCDSLVHRNLRSVTSIGPNQNNFNTNDSANLSFGQKPKILELANRRLVQTMLDIVGGPPAAVGSEQDASADTDVRRHAFSRMLPLWIRASMKRTSMWDTRSVFILLDLIEGLIYTLSYPAPSQRDSDADLIVPKPSESSLDLFDIQFIFSCVKIILGNADNTVALMRTIAFIYAHFEIFTLRPSDRDELCEHVILDEVLFERMYLHWNAGVRGYFIRLLVWRLSRLGITDAEQHPDRPRDPRILAIFGLMNERLEAIRKRHDELEPVQTLNDEDNFFQPKRSTICSTRGVKEAPFTVDELAGLFESDTEDDEDDSQELVSSNVPAAENGRGAGGGGGKSGIMEVATVARVVSWLKGGLGKKSGSGGLRRGDLFADDESNSSPKTDTYEDVGDATTVEDGSSDGTRSSTTAPTTADTELESSAGSQSTPEATRRAKRSSRGPAFFAFEFENGLSPRSEVPDDSSASPTPRTGSSSMPSDSDAVSIASHGTADTVFPLASGLRRSASLDPNSAPPPPHAAVVSPRVSARFSKRISILPPAALEMFKEGVPVPSIPAQYRQDKPRGYDRKLHPYAVRGLRDYEDALDEWTDWVARLQEEEDEGRKHNRGFVDTVPRLAVSWPQSFEEGA
ncbi:hypothetical protein ACM66B_000446 [Microbotryomycetes sp. NB124-2]